MADRSTIEWTNATWNPLVGCSRVSAGCQHCYAERHAYRFARQAGSVFEGTARLVNGIPTFTGRVNINERVLDQPLRWREPRKVFVNSMSDLFHENVSDAFIDRVFAVMALCREHTFQVLTKRPERMRDYCGALLAGKRCIAESATALRGSFISGLAAMAGFGVTAGDMTIKHMPRNIWLGVSVEDQAAADSRIPLLLQTPAAVRFLSCEPLLGPVDLRKVHRRPAEGGISAWHSLDGYCRRHFPRKHCGCREQEPAIDWVIAGGESGPGARPMHPEWARSLRDQCAAARVPFFFKQWGAWASVSEVEGPGAHHQFPDGATVRRTSKRRAGHLLDGVEHHAFPEAQA